jgi:predicted PurR-regulated permease PerM
MLTFVLIFNLLITLINLFVAWRIWQLQKFLVKATKTLNKVERITHSLLSSAPEIIAKEQKDSFNLKQKHQKLKLQLQRVQKILTILILGYNIWQKQTKLEKRSKRAKKLRANELMFSWLRYPVD